jgi:hypothetical protein
MDTYAELAAIAVTFFILGVALEMVIATAVMSRLIDRRQREIRRWQDEVQRLHGTRAEWY